MIKQEKKLTFRLPEELYINFNQYCKYNGYSISKRLRILIENEINKK